MDGPRLEGQTGTPHYMTEPPEPGWTTETRGANPHSVEVRFENGHPWVREKIGSHWGSWRKMDGDGKFDPAGERLVSVQPDWCRALPIQQQSVLLLAARGPDGMRKHHPAKNVIKAYRACVLHAASAARPLRVSEEGDSFMSAHWLRDDLWNQSASTRGVVESYFDHVDEVPHHYHLHLLHGAQILGAHHPSAFIKRRWHEFYERGCDDMHLTPEPVGVMNDRLNDFGRSPGGQNGARR